MKQFNITLLLILLMSMASTKAFAYDIAVENADGKTIYYNYINNGTELEVTHTGDSYSKYSGNIVIPETVNYMNRSRKVTSIGKSAFAGIESERLTSVTIPNSVTEIGENAFNGRGLDSVTIGNGVTSIGNNAFYKCNRLKKVIVSDIAAWCGISFYSSNSNPLCYAKHLYSDENTEITNLVIPNSVTSINRYSFEGCSSLTSVTIGNDVTSIGENAFYGCTGLTSVTIGNSVTSIDDNAFNLCSGLTSVTIPNSVTSLGVNAFRGCTGLTSVTIGNSVTSIGVYAFMGCTGLTSVTIPNSVTSIGSRVFQDCSGLTSVTIGNSVTSIGKDAFYKCNGLKKVIVSDIAAWCGISFNSDYSNPLYYAKHLYSDENTEITNLVIPNSVTSIGDYAFYGCSGLTSVTIGNSVTSIGNSAFYGCSGLTSVTIGSGVKEIGERAFNCNNLATVISKIETPFAINGKSSSDPVFSSNTFMNADLFVPVGTIDKYKATEGWKDFMWITEGIPSGIGEVKTEVDKTEVSRYTIDGKKLSESQEGINIIKMSDGTTKKVIVK